MDVGVAVFQGRPQLRHYNPLGAVHGGWFATLLDSALGCAVHSALPAGKGYTTLELKVNIVRALTEAVPLDCTTVFVVDNVIVDWLGASSGSLSQLDPPKMVKANTAHTMRFHEAERPVMMESIGSERAV